MPTPPLPSGRYMTKSRIENDGEAWLKGAPEIEVHVHGPTEPANPLYGADLSCSGQEVIGPKSFNQNERDWSGNVMILTEAENADFGAKFSNGYNVMLWEDDDTACRIRSDNVDLAAAVRAVGGMTTGVVAMVTAKNPTTIAAGFGTFAAAIFVSASFLKSNDDYLGLATRIEYTPLAGSYTDANYILYKQGNVFNGRINVVDK